MYCFSNDPVKSSMLPDQRRRKPVCIASRGKKQYQ